MIQLDQIRTLEQKVKQAVALISRLKSENEYLKGRLTDTEVRILELEELIGAFRNSQTEIEAGLKSAIAELDLVEGSPDSPVPGETSSQEEAVAASTELNQPEVVEVHLQVENPASEEEPILESTHPIQIEDQGEKTLEASSDLGLFDQDMSEDDYEQDLFLESALGDSVHEDPKPAPSQEDPNLGIF